MNVTVYGPLRSATGSKSIDVDVDGGTVDDALHAFVDAYPRARPQLFDDGRLRPSVRLSIDGERVDPADPCDPDDTLSIHPAVRGGAE